MVLPKIWEEELGVVGSSNPETLASASLASLSSAVSRDVAWVTYCVDRLAAEILSETIPLDFKQVEPLREEDCEGE
jgi:hypothetical protein